MSNKTQVGDQGDLGQMQQCAAMMMFVGGLLVLSGLLAASYAFTTSVIATTTIGLFFVLLGIFHVFGAVFSRKTQYFFFTIITGLLGASLGAWMMYQPALSLLALTWLFALFFVITGLVRMVSAIVYRQSLNGLAVFASGFLSVLLGGLIYLHWPVSGLWVIGFFIGIELILAGVSFIVVGYAARNAQYR